jgi:hypothetical protein
MDNAKRRLETLLRKPAKDTPVSEATHGTDHPQDAGGDSGQVQKGSVQLIYEQKNWKLVIITGFITHSDLTKNLDRSQKTSVELGAGTGPPSASPFEAQCEGEHSRSHEFGVK